MAGVHSDHDCRPTFAHIASGWGSHHEVVARRPAELGHGRGHILAGRVLSRKS